MESTLNEIVLNAVKQKLNTINNGMKKLYSKRVEGKTSIEDFKLQYDELKSKLKETKKYLEQLQKKNKSKISEKNLKKIVIGF